MESVVNQINVDVPAVKNSIITFIQTYSDEILYSVHHFNFAKLCKFKTTNFNGCYLILIFCYIFYIKICLLRNEKTSHKVTNANLFLQHLIILFIINHFYPKYKAVLRLKCEDSIYTV